MKITAVFHQITKKLQGTLTQIMNWLSLNIIFFLGIGSTSLIAKVFKKNFFKNPSPSSSWQKVNYQSQVNENMF